MKGLSQVEINTFPQLFNLIQKAAKSRIVDKTQFNERSSRSHCIYKIHIIFDDSVSKKAEGYKRTEDRVGEEWKKVEEGVGKKEEGGTKREEGGGKKEEGGRREEGGMKEGTLNIVDLAGSERCSFGEEGGDREKLKKIQNEANFINKSLTTLGRIIRLISEKQPIAAIPYRESKLTRILQVLVSMVKVE